MSKAAQADLFPIRTVASLTGVNVITLRAWERRYGLIKPVRTPTGRRLYRRDDIDRIHRTLDLLKQGISIGQATQSLDQDASQTNNAADTVWSGYQARMINAIVHFDEAQLDDTYDYALALHPIERVTEELLLPLLAELGKRWEAKQGSVAEEHFFGVYLRNKLGARFHHRTRGANGPRLLAACLPGELHEIGLLLFALAAHERGFQVVLLGANLPIEEVAAAAKQARCDAIVLSGSIAVEREVLRKHLPAVVNAGTPVFVGGMVSIRERDAIVIAGAIPLGNEIPSGIERIRWTLPAVSAHK